MDVDFIAEKVPGLLELPVEEVWVPGRYKQLVTAKSLISRWTVRELGVSQASLVRRFGISEVAISKSVRRGAEIVKREGYELDIVS